MTIPEEIEQLKLKLENTAGEREQADVLLEILNKYTRNSTDTQPYIDRLLLLAEKLDDSLYKAWGLCYGAHLNLLKSEYDVSIDLSRQALLLFEVHKERKGTATCYNILGSVYERRGNYPGALKNHFASMKFREEIGDKKGIATSYNNFGMVYERQGNYPEALKNHFASLKCREEIGDKPGIGDSYNNIGIVYYCQGNFPEALKNHFASLKHREEIGDKTGISDSYNNIGIVYYNIGNYPEALKNHFASIKCREGIGDKRSIGNSYTNIGVVYYSQGNYPEALKNYFASLEIREEIDDKPGIAASYSNIGIVYHSQGNYTEALKDFFASLKLGEEIGDKKSIATSYNNIGLVYERQANYPEALKHHFASLKLKEEIGDKPGIAASYSNIGVIYHSEGNYPEALKNHFVSLKLAEEISSQALLKECVFGLFDTYKAAGDFENALKYYEKYHEIEKETLGEESQKQLTNLSFMHNLEQKEKDLEIEHLRNVELKKERDRSETLLLNILPAEVAEELKDKGTAAAKHFNDVTVLFTDFKGFTNVSERLTPQQLVDELHACFSAFDEICGRYNIEKIKTVGDAYLAVSGLPLANPNHAEDMVKAAIEIRDFMLKRRAEAPFRGLGGETFEVRIGVHSGSVVAGIVGVKKFAYDIWGDTVNTAARMEQNSEAGKINISNTTYDLVKDKFTCEYRGEIEAKNKGKLKMYFVK